MDVVIAGAGPVGLMLAAELRAEGVDVLVVDREPDPDLPHKRDSMGARALNSPTVVALHERGLLPAVQKAALFWVDGTPQDDPPPFVGHFAGIPSAPTCSTSPPSPPTCPAVA
ncbi:hypothetical protein GCM10029964_076890 [Kibdelosporangium lantanae]